MSTVEEMLTRHYEHERKFVLGDYAKGSCNEKVDCTRVECKELGRCVETIRMLDLLPFEDRVLLRFKYMGDYSSKSRLHEARKLQERFRMQGKRIKLSYTYSYRQLGKLTGKCHKTIKRRVDKSMAILERYKHENER